MLNVRKTRPILKLVAPIVSAFSLDNENSHFCGGHFQLLRR